MMQQRASTTAAILRHTLFEPSETFIPDQASQLPVDVVLIARDEIKNPRPEFSSRSISEFGGSAVQRYVAGIGSGYLARLLRGVGAEVVHAHFGVEGSYAAPAARSSGIPLVTTLHGFDVTVSTARLYRSLAPSWVRYASRRRKFLSQSDHLICVSGHIAKRALALGAPENALTVINTGVDLDKFDPTAVPDEPSILHVARLVEKKGTADLIRAMQVLRLNHPDVTLRVVGDGPLRRELENLAVALGVADRIVWLGSLPHSRIKEEMRAARLVVCPSVTASSGDTEGLPQVILEAGATARPVVATVHAGIPEAIEHGVSGLLVPERQYLQLAEAVANVLKDNNLASQLGARAREKVAAQYDIRVQAQKVADVYALAQRG